MSPTKNEPSPPRQSPLKRKLEHEENEPSTQQNETSLVSPTRRITRSQSTQALQALPTTLPASPPKRTRSSNSIPTPSPSPTPNSTSPICRLRDTIPPNLILLFIGVNPGIMTGQTGFVYAHPSNRYWKLLYTSGITARRHPPCDTYRLPALYGVGNTNIVARPTRDASMLSKAEMDAGVAVLEEKVRANRPEAVCLVGKSIWEAVWRVRRGRGIRKEEFRYGWQDEGENMGVVRVRDQGEGEGEGWEGARVFVATTTSGLAATMSMAEKEAVWNELGAWVKRRREERGFVAAVN
ncbi:uracil DNA N-glycosylase Thp1 [Emydomyces testavorans]|uniref:Uracil DNA N-glycosylase Thp1 n=1 Tax=Emydomyces testavorans TaxID=2070801 RepID=A0AAF0DNK1_9EURO|nr:uracil DNA N-glycosylase Thp1 [Emydomyces testavorans]